MSVMGLCEEVYRLRWLARRLEEKIPLLKESTVSMQSTMRRSPLRPGAVAQGARAFAELKAAWKGTVRSGAGSSTLGWASQLGEQGICSVSVSANRRSVDGLPYTTRTATVQRFNRHRNSHRAGGSAVRGGATSPRRDRFAMYINIGDYLGAGSLGFASVIGSCATDRRARHVSRPAQIGGVLEPSAPCRIVEDDVR